MKKNLIILILMFLFTPLFAKNTMVFVEGGKTELGDKAMDDNSIHTVELSNFYMAKYLVTMREFKEFLADSKLPFSWDGRITWNPGFLSIREAAPTDNCPAQGMTWLYAILYCNWLSKKENLTPCYEFPNGLGDFKLYENMIWNHKANGYRLPTEAEWEYAARGGQLRRGYKYPGSNDLNEVNKESAVSYEIGQMKPNELGIHDMGGLVSEYCYDWYDERMWEWLSQKDPCFENLSMMKNKETFNWTKCYRGADWYWNPKGTFSWRNDQFLDGGSTTGIRLVRSNIDDNEINNKIFSKIDYSTLDEKNYKEFQLILSEDGTITLDGEKINKDSTVIINGLKLKIGEKSFISLDKEFCKEEKNE